MTIGVSHAGLTDPGLVRARNEDSWSADPELGLYAVSDGIGGLPAGAVASEIVTTVLPKLVHRELAGLMDLASPEAADALARILVLLSEQLRGESEREPGLSGMGATVVLVLLRGPSAYVAHMGDSRAYLLRAGDLAQLTHDHSVVQLLVDMGEIDPTQAMDHPSRGQVTRYVGMEGDPLPEVQRIGIEPGDRLLLCTDGLTSRLGDDRIRQVLVASADAEAACAGLVAAANEAGGRDNVTAVVVDLAEQ